MNNDFCTEQIYDCGENTVATEDGCVSVSQQSLKDDNIPTFTFSHLKYNDIDTSVSPFVKFDGLTLVGSLEKSLSYPQTAMVEFSRKSGLDDTGTCYLYSKADDDQKGKDVLSLFYIFPANASQIEKFSFPKNPYDPNPTFIVVDTTQTTPSKTSRIKSSYQGSSCRKWATDTDIDPSKNSDSLTDFGLWCGSNKNIDVCKEFSETVDYAPFVITSPPYLFYISLSIFLIILFLFGLFRVRNYSTLYIYTISILLGLSILFLIFSSWYNFIRPEYSGSQKDYTASANIINNPPDLSNSGNVFENGSGDINSASSYVFALSNTSNDDPANYNVCKDEIGNCLESWKNPKTSFQPTNMYFDKTTGVFIENPYDQSKSPVSTISFDDNGNITQTYIDAKTKKVIEVDNYNKAKNTDFLTTSLNSCLCCTDPTQAQANDPTLNCPQVLCSECPVPSDICTSPVCGF